MDYQDYTNLYTLSAILCGLMFIISVILFICFRVPKIIGELTGISARKAIKKNGDALNYTGKTNKRQLNGLFHTGKTAGQSRTTPGNSDSTEQGLLIEDANKTEVLTPRTIEGEEDNRTEVLNYQRMFDSSTDDIEFTDEQMIITEDITFIHTEETIKEWRTNV